MGEYAKLYHAALSSIQDHHFWTTISKSALHHTIGDKVEAAYGRGDLIEKRKRMMEDWAKFCSTIAKAGNVLAMYRR